MVRVIDVKRREQKLTDDEYPKSATHVETESEGIEVERELAERAAHGQL